VNDARLRLLLCDDSDHVRRYMRRTLDSDDRIEIAGEAALVSESIEQYQALRPDVVILDIQMPDGSGYEALRAIKEIDEDALVMMLTNYADPIFRQACMRAGANYFFDKTTEFHRVSELLNELLDERADA
jgi:DNA-binding NarL/FixJ family response regulator